MTAANVAMSGIMAQTRYLIACSEQFLLRERVMAVGLVMLLHVAVFGAGALQTEKPSVIVSEMSVSMAQEQSSQAQMEPQPKPVKSEPVPKQIEEVAEPEPEPEVKKQTVEAPVAAIPLESKPSAPVALDTQPDFRADYLNNPRPPYPMVARRMGYHGKVVLNVEVLAEGRAGQVQLYASSGHDILDNAALQTVKGWRFTPARRFGQAVTEWFLVPINFSLEDNNA